MTYTVDVLQLKTVHYLQLDTQANLGSIQMPYYRTTTCLTSTRVLVYHHSLHLKVWLWNWLVIDKSSAGTLCSNISMLSLFLSVLVNFLVDDVSITLPKGTNRIMNYKNLFKYVNIKFVDSFPVYLSKLSCWWSFSSMRTRTNFVRYNNFKWLTVLSTIRMC